MFSEHVAYKENSLDVSIEDEYILQRHFFWNASLIPERSSPSYPHNSCSIFVALAMLSACASSPSSHDKQSIPALPFGNQFNTDWAAPLKSMR